MSIVKSIKILSEKLVGSTTPNKGIEENIAYIAENYSGGGGSGGGGALRVNYTIEEDGSWTLDRTFAEIRDAYFNGQNVYLYMPNEDPELWDILPLVGQLTWD